MEQNSQPQPGRPETAANESARALLKLADATEKLQGGLDQDRKMWRTRIRTMSFLIAVSLIVGAFMAIVVTQNYIQANSEKDRRAENSQILRDTAKTSQRIADCTTIGGECYEQGSVRLQQALRFQLVTEHCSRITETFAELEACVLRMMTPVPAPTPRPSPRPNATPNPDG